MCRKEFVASSHWPNNYYCAAYLNYIFLDVFFELSFFVARCSKNSGLRIVETERGRYSDTLFIIHVSCKERHSLNASIL